MTLYLHSVARVRAWLCCTLLAAPFTAGASTLQGDVSRDLQREGIAGAVWATIDADGTVQTGAAGMADTDRGRRMRPDDRVHVGSVMKAVLATGVLRLVSEGRIGLDDPVAPLLPSVVFDNAWGASDPVRIRHLLDHTAGLSDSKWSRMFSLKITPDLPLLQSAGADRGPLHVRSRPGTRYSYSNVGYTLLGMVIETVTGQRYEHWLDTQLLAPLGMRDSTFAFVTQTGANADARLAMGHLRLGQPQSAVPLYPRPAGQFTTTASDMARFAGFLLSDGRVDGKPFIHPALMRARGHATTTDAARAGLPGGYGLGLYLRDGDGRPGLCHAGDTVGFHAMLCVFPEQRQGYFVAFNRDVQSPRYTAIRTRIVETLGVPDRSPRTAPRVAGSDDARRWTGFYVPAPTRHENFAWMSTVFGAVHLAPEGDALVVQSLQAPPLRLEALGGRLFRQPERTHASHVLFEADGQPTMFAKDHQTYARISPVALGGLWASLIAGLLGLLVIVVMGVVRLLKRTRWKQDPFRMPLLGTIALAIPIPLFMQQTFLQRGDFTIASAALAAVTIAWPLTLLAGLAMTKASPRVGVRWVERVAIIGVLQWLGVLAAWGLMPLRLWVI